MSKNRWALFLLSAAMLLSAALIVLLERTPQERAQAASGEQRTFFAMDTVMTLNIPDADDALLQACADRIAELEGLLSVTDASSEIARLNASGSAHLSPDTEKVLRFALDMGQDTGGALDVTLYPVVRAWGFTTGEYRVPSKEELTALLRHVDFSSVLLEDAHASLPDGSMVDLGSVAKGYASDALVLLLKKAGIRTGLLDLGGNIHCIGTKSDGSAWRIAIRNPLGEGQCGVLTVSDCAVVTSGCYERCFTAEDGTVYGHIFDPETGCPVENGILSVTVVGQSGALCDALSTALFVMGAEEACQYLQRRTDAEAVLFCEDGRILATSGLRDAFTPLGIYQDQTIHWIDRTGNDQ